MHRTNGAHLQPINSQPSPQSANNLATHLVALWAAISLPALPGLTAQAAELNNSSTAITAPVIPGRNISARVVAELQFPFEANFQRAFFSSDGVLVVRVAGGLNSYVMMDGEFKLKEAIKVGNPDYQKFPAFGSEGTLHSILVAKEAPLVAVATDGGAVSIFKISKDGKLRQTDRVEGKEMFVPLEVSSDGKVIALLGADLESGEYRYNVVWLKDGKISARNSVPADHVFHGLAKDGSAMLVGPDTNIMGPLHYDATAYTLNQAGHITAVSLPGLWGGAVPLAERTLDFIATFDCRDAWLSADGKFLYKLHVAYENENKGDKKETGSFIAYSLNGDVATPITSVALSDSLGIYGQRVADNTFIIKYSPSGRVISVNSDGKALLNVDAGLPVYFNQTLEDAGIAVRLLPEKNSLQRWSADNEGALTQLPSIDMSEVEASFDHSEEATWHTTEISLAPTGTVGVRSGTPADDFCPKSVIFGINERTNTAFPIYSLARSPGSGFYDDPGSEQFLGFSGDGRYALIGVNKNCPITEGGKKVSFTIQDLRVLEMPIPN